MPALDCRDRFQLVTVIVGTPTVIKVMDNDVQIVHMGVQDNSLTASAAGDYIVVMDAADMMAADFMDGVKLPIFPGGSGTIRGADAKVVAADKAREYQIQAVGHAAKVAILKGSLYGSKE